MKFAVILKAILPLSLMVAVLTIVWSVLQSTNWCDTSPSTFGGDSLWYPSVLSTEKNTTNNKGHQQPLHEISNVEAAEEEEFEIYEMPLLYEQEQYRIDQEDINEKCNRYGLNVTKHPQKRRLFFGSMIADEEWELLKIHAVETYNVYHVAAFVEANTTHDGSPRTVRFLGEGGKAKEVQKSQLFGNQTSVIFDDVWYTDDPGLLFMDRESEQRNAIVGVWKRAGMRPNDIGVMGDVDEVFARDLLRALQHCDFPILRPGQTCQTPKLIPATIQYETSPYCVKKNRWFHPDVIKGECIDGIGDPTERMVPPRSYRRRYGERTHDWGFSDQHRYPDYVKNSSRFPLFNGADIRTTAGATGATDIVHRKRRPKNYSETVSGTAYHFHNWFANFSTVRNKYTTYAHGDPLSLKRTLGNVADDIDVFVRCVHGLDNSYPVITAGREYYVKKDKLWFPQKPIYFTDEAYCRQRHELMEKLLILDEAKYGKTYSENGTWIKPPEELL